MAEWELDVVRENARAAPTDDLLDRVTAYRAGMEPEALRVIEEELARRGINATSQLPDDLVPRPTQVSNHVRQSFRALSA
jgi:hypothetical protein